MARQVKQPFVVADKDFRQRRGQTERKHRQRDAGYAHQRQAFFQHALQLVVVTRAVVIADNRRAADAVADGCTDEDELHIHQHAVGGNAVLAQHAQKLHVIEHGDERRGNVAHKLGRTVCAGLEDGRRLKFEGSEAKRKILLAEDIHCRNDAADALADARRQRRARQPPAENRDEQRVEHHVRHARRDNDQQPHARPLSHDQEALKHALQHERRCERNGDAAVKHAIRHDALACAHQPGDWADEGDAQHGQDQTGDDHETDHHGENAVGSLRVAAAHLLGNQRAAARAEHEARAAEHHDERHDEIQRRERRFADVI